MAGTPENYPINCSTDEEMTEEKKEYGSQYWLRVAINDARSVIDRELLGAMDDDQIQRIEWVSPLSPEFTEYQDQAFLDKLGISPARMQLADFWPKGGPVWDALARTATGRVFLCEAKAHIPEVNTPESGASPKSLRRIAASLNETRAFLNADPIVDWTRTFFQYTNRIAHLYFLREINGIDAYLVNVYFLNDAKMNGPSSASEWKGALALLKTHLGVTRTKLSPFMKDIFIDTEELKDRRTIATRLQVTRADKQSENDHSGSLAPQA
jgi:hypothetical protein